MEKNISYSIQVDGVQLEDLPEIQERIEEIFKEYRDKRIQVQVQDEPLVNFR